MTSPRIALITGANRGLGMETAKQLGRQGIRIIAAARTAAAGQATVATLTADGIAAESVVLEVTDHASIAAAAAEVGRRHGRLDILINNAGILDYGADTGPETTSPATVRRVYEVNVVGLVAVTQTFLPLLKAAPAGRIVNLSSILGSCAEHADANSPIHHFRFPAYDMSKAAVNMYTVELAQALRGTAIKVNAAHPGWVKTEMGGPDAPMEIPDGAKTTVALATLPDNGPSGGYFHMGVHMRW